jgi:hypothetical protein
MFELLPFGGTLALRIVALAGPAARMVFRAAVLAGWGRGSLWPGDAS